MDLQSEQDGEHGEEQEAGKQQRKDDDLGARMAGVAARAAIVCSYEEEARHLDRLTRALNEERRSLENERLKGTDLVPPYP